MSSIYTINKGINTPVSFKGFKAQYIWYLGGGFVLLLVLFAVLYILGMHPVLCLLVVGSLGTLLVVCLGELSRKYGAYGLQKKWAKKRLPHTVRCTTRQVFIKGLTIQKKIKA